MAKPDDTGISTGGPNAGSQPAGGGGMSLPFDPWRLVAALWRRWLVIGCCGLVLAILGGVAGYMNFTTEYKATAQLMRQESSVSFRASEIGEPFKPRQLSVMTLVSFVKSPAVMQRVEEQTQISSRTIAGGLGIAPERNTDIISLSMVSSKSPQTAVRVLNAFGSEVVRLTRDMQMQESSEMNRLLKRQLLKAEDDLRAVSREALEFSQEAGLINVDKEIDAYLRSLGDLDMRYETAKIDFETLDLKISALEKELAINNPLAEKVQQAEEKLAALLQQYTEANPLVQEQQSVVAELKTQLKAAGTQPIKPPRQGEGGLATSFYSELLGLRTQKKVAAVQLEKLKTVREGVEEKLRGLPEKGVQLARIKARQQSLEAAQQLLASRQREAQLYEESALGYYRFFDANLEEVETAGRSKKLIMVTGAAGVVGLALAAALVCLAESFDDRIKTVADLKRCTKLPLLATLPELDRLDSVAQSSWAFRTWLGLQAGLKEGPDRLMVCGFASSSRGEGCSTWLELLGRAASQRDEAVIVITNRAPANGRCLALETAMADPAQVSLIAGKVQWVLIPDNWLWDSARRKQWQSALECWRSSEGAVVLVELSAEDQPETLLFAEGLSQIIWLAGSGAARSRQITEKLQSYQHAGCRFVGAVLNRESKLFPWL
jgi:capsular polysaccharide biosynthesis protein